MAVYLPRYQQAPVRFGTDARQCEWSPEHIYRHTRGRWITEGAKESQVRGVARRPVPSGRAHGVGR